MNDSDNVLRIGLFIDYQIRFPILDLKNRRVEVVDRSRLPLSIIKNITQEHTETKYMRGAHLFIRHYRYTCSPFI